MSTMINTVDKVDTRCNADVGYYECACCGKTFYLPITCPTSTYAYKIVNKKDKCQLSLCCSWHCFNELKYNRKQKKSS